MSGVKGRSGRKGSHAKRLSKAMGLIESNMPSIVETLLYLAIEKKDREAATYLLNRIYGNPRQEIDQRIKQLQLTVSGDDLARLSQQIELAERELLDAGTQ